MNKEKDKTSTGFKAFLAKFGFKTFTVFLKGLKFLKFGLAAATLAIYSSIFTWKFALLIMIAIGWHESGHVWAMKKLGFRTKGFYFLPFLGGVAVQTDAYKTYAQNVFVSIMGPVWGLLLTLLSCMLYYSTHIPLFAAAAGWMAFINLFNLFPINPLDGGQIVRSIAFSVGKRAGIIFLFVSLILGILVLYKMNIGLMALITIIGALDLFGEFWKKYRVINQRVKLYEKTAKSCLKSGDNEGHDFFMRQAKAQTLLNEDGPTPMRGKEFVFAIASYVLTAFVLIVIIHLMAQEPGASVAATFLADK